MPECGRVTGFQKKGENVKLLFAQPVLTKSILVVVPGTRCFSLARSILQRENVDNRLRSCLGIRREIGCKCFGNVSGTVSGGAFHGTRCARVVEIGVVSLDLFPIVLRVAIAVFFFPSTSTRFAQSTQVLLYCVATSSVQPPSYPISTATLVALSTCHFPRIPRYLCRTTLAPKMSSIPNQNRLSF